MKLLIKIIAILFCSFNSFAQTEKIEKKNYITLQTNTLDYFSRPGYSIHLLYRSGKNQYQLAYGKRTDTDDNSSIENIYTDMEDFRNFINIGYDRYVWKEFSVGARLSLQEKILNLGNLQATENIPSIEIPLAYHFHFLNDQLSIMPWVAPRIMTSTNELKLSDDIVYPANNTFEFGYGINVGYTIKL